jgi:hypothetical protein
MGLLMDSFLSLIRNASVKEKPPRPPANKKHKIIDVPIYSDPNKKGRSWKRPFCFRFMVELRGIEPLTS